MGEILEVHVFFFSQDRDGRRLGLIIVDDGGDPPTLSVQ